MATVNPIYTGTALAVTVGIGYTACTLVFWLWPEAAAYFMNALFHGLDFPLFHGVDFRKLQSGPTSFDFGLFLYALVALVAWAFMLGTIYGWALGRFGNKQ